jgi:copper chaperone CopZ
MSSITYPLIGLHCNACVGRVTKALAPLAEEVQVSLTPQQVLIKNSRVSMSDLQAAVSAAGKYVLSAPEKVVEPTLSASPEKSWLQTYQPLLLILGFVLASSVLVQVGQGRDAVWHETMRYFMAGFFLVFSFFKLLDIRAFANAYAGYDLLAAKWHSWGLIYPFVELALGLAYLANWNPAFTHITTLLVMGFSAIGVIRAVLSKTKIQCACLGTVFQLPMSTVTIVEDVGMVLMAAMMLLVR